MTLCSLKQVTSILIDWGFLIDIPDLKVSFAPEMRHLIASLISIIKEVINCEDKYTSNSFFSEINKKFNSRFEYKKKVE